MNSNEIRNYIDIVEYRNQIDDKIGLDDSTPRHWIDKLVAQMEVNSIFSIDYVSKKMDEMAKASLAQVEITKMLNMRVVAVNFINNGIVP